MPVIDAHCHASKDWYEPVESLLFQMDRYGVERACLVQTLAETRNEYLFECRRRFPDRFAIVAGIDFGVESPADLVREAAEQGATGIRLRSAWANDAKFAAVLDMMSRKRLNASCAGDAASFLAPVFADHMAAYPGIVFVLEHLGGLARPDFDRAETTRDAILGYARLPNAMLKVSGLGQIRRQSPQSARLTPPLDPDGLKLLPMAIEAFGPQRLMWGSDYPPVSSREGYGNALNWTYAEIESLNPEQNSLIFQATAQSVFFRGLD